MNGLPRHAAALAAILALSSGASAQRKKPLTLDLVLEHSRSLLPKLPAVQWVPGTHTLSRLQGGLRGPRVELLDAGAGGKAKVAFGAGELRAALETAGVKAIAKAGLPAFTWLDAERLRVRRGEAIYHWTVGAKKARLVLRLPEGAVRTAFASRDRQAACIVGHDLMIVAAGGKRRRITWDGSEDIVYGGAAHRSEFGIHDGLWWGPEGRFLAFYREDLRSVDLYPYVDHTTMPPRAIHGRYPFAGRKNSIVTVGVYDSRDDSVRFLENDPALDLYWTNITFTPNGEGILVALVNRGQDHMDLVRFNTKSGKRERVLFSEQNSKWIEPQHGPIFVPDGSGRFLWFSPRSGFRHLYLFGRGGKLIRAVTSGPRDIAELVGFTSNGSAALVMASDQDPLQMQLWRADLASDSMHRLTRRRGWHSCQACTDGAFVIDVSSNLESPPRMDLLRTDKDALTTLVRASDPLSDHVMGRQRFFSVPAEDGTELHGHLILPPGADEQSGHRYPVLHYVYGGPHSQLVRDTWLGGASLWLHYMASRGFVVSRLDNRGTDNRGLAFAQAIHRHLGQIETADQLAAIHHVQSLPFVDPARVGVHGWSFGGFMTLNLMLRAPDVFACGIAGAPVTDWAGYETGYTERYMDTPQENPQGYASSSMLRRAKDLKGRLLIAQGTGDETVMWSHSLAFVDACIDAGVLIDYMPYPMQKHGLRGKDRSHFFRLMTRYLVEHLRP